MLSSLNIVILGVILSIIFYELTDISPGGIIVPGILVLYFSNPEKIIYTILVALVSYFLVKFLSKFTLIFGKRRFVLLILVSIVINLILGLLFKTVSMSMISVSIIGYTIPGIIANDFYKQGIKKTIPACAIVTCLLEVIILVSKVIG